MINIGIIGLGFMGATHLKSYRKVPNARIAAICDANGRHLDGDFSDVAGNLPGQEPLKLDMVGVKASSDINDLLTDPDLQLIDICTPTPQHHPLVLAALQAGKHVICEKPFARTSEQAREMVAAAAIAGRFLMPAMCLRFWPEWAWIKRAIDEQTYGKALAARFRRVAQAPGWGTYLQGEDSGGALLDLHIHDVDFIQHCFGQPTSVFATGYSILSGAMDHVVTQYQFKSGLIAHAEGGWTMAEGFGFNMACTVNFETATADYDLARGADSLKLFEKGKEPRTVKCEGEDGFVGELTHIVNAVETGRPPSVVTAADGLRAVEICEAEERSIQTGQVVSLSQESLRRNNP